jgi:hypothetical protein
MTRLLAGEPVTAGDAGDGAVSGEIGETVDAGDGRKANATAATSKRFKQSETANVLLRLIDQAKD